MTNVGDEFRRRWASMRHVAAWRPTQIIQVRTGQLVRGYQPWAGTPVQAKIPGETKEKPWQATWTPLSAWLTLPTVIECTIEQSFDSNGIATATITMENTAMVEASNLGVLYHYIDRGALAPWRGYNAPGQPWWQVPPNEWYEKLLRNSQIRIWQGYGGDVLVSPFTGLIDDVDPQGTPPRLVVTCRDFGKVLVEERLFGDVDGPKVKDPVTFIPKPKGLTGIGEAAGHSAKATSERQGHPARYVTDRDVKTVWITQDHSDGGVTEWVEIRVPKGRYESIALHPAYNGMEGFLGVFARSALLGGEPAQMDDVNFADGWLTVDADEGGGIVPGTYGGWPYIKHWPTLADAGKSYRLDHKLELGEDSVFRLAFRNLKHIGNGVHRGGAARFKAIKRKSERSVALRLVGKDADASTSRDGHGPSKVLDDDTQTTWISHDHTDGGVTEWVHIHVPQGRYESFQIYTEYGGMDMYVGVYARDRKRKKKSGKGYVHYPSQINDVDVPDEHFITHGDLGDVPGTHGGWPMVGFYPNIGPHSKHKPEKFYITNDHAKFELGDDSVIRVGFRHLPHIGNGIHRAQVGKFKAYTRTGVKQPPKPEPDARKIEVNDPSDIVRCVLRWAGFKEWIIEDTGAPLKDPWVFNRQTYLRDVIKKVEEVTGFVFYIAPPTENDLSIGVPVFRRSQLMRDDLPTILVKDTDMLTGLQAKFSEEMLGYIIRVRGKADPGGSILGSDHTKKLTAVYRPPWWRNMGRVLKHIVHEEKRLTDQKSCEVFARLIALQEALQSATATMEVPGNPEFELDGQAAMWDTGTGMKSRIYVSNISSTFTQGKGASWKTTVGGSLLDTPDIVGVRTDLFAILPPGAPSQELSDLIEGM